MTRSDQSVGLIMALLLLGPGAIAFDARNAVQAPAGRGGRPQEPGPTITVRGHTFSQLSLFQRNVGGPDDMTTAFPPHKVIGNIYYVGTRSLAVYLIVTPQGNILINSTFERNVPLIQQSVEQLGFKFSEIKILLGSHAHGDHQEGDAAVKAQTGAQVMALAEDVPALRAMKPGGKEHPIDKVLHDGESVTLGGTTLVAHLTPGHSRGCTTWTLKAQEGGKSYDVVIIGSLGTNPGFKLVNNTETPGIAEEFARAFKASRALPCDVPLGSHPGMYNMQAKYAKLAAGGPNPFIDPDGYKLELDIDEAMFRAVLAEHPHEPNPRRRNRSPSVSGRPEACTTTEPKTLSASRRLATAAGLTARTTLAICAARIVARARIDSIRAPPCRSSMASTPAHPSRVISGTTNASLATSPPLTMHIWAERNAAAVAFRASRGRFGSCASTSSE